MVFALRLLARAPMDRQPVLWLAARLGVGMRRSTAQPASGKAVERATCSASPGDDPFRRSDRRPVPYRSNGRRCASPAGRARRHDDRVAPRAKRIQGTITHPLRRVQAAGSAHPAARSGRSARCPADSPGGCAALHRQKRTGRAFQVQIAQPDLDKKIQAVAEQRSRLLAASSSGCRGSSRPAGYSASCQLSVIWLELHRYCAAQRHRQVFRSQACPAAGRAGHDYRSRCRLHPNRG